jgi:hypothetical protein
MKNTNSLVLSACICFSAFANAKEPLTQADFGIYNQLIKCEISFRLFTVNGDTGYRECISSGNSEIKKLYEKFSKTIKKPSARTALKEYYIAGVMALQGIEPQSDERTINYEKRQGDNKNKLNEMWVRFETEN